MMRSCVFGIFVAGPMHTEFRVGYCRNPASENKVMSGHFGQEDSTYSTVLLEVLFLN
jgi:hypothetical protein